MVSYSRVPSRREVSSSMGGLTVSENLINGIKVEISGMGENFL